VSLLLAAVVVVSFLPSLIEVNQRTFEWLFFFTVPFRGEQENRVDVYELIAS